MFSMASYKCASISNFLQAAGTNRGRVKLEINKESKYDL